MPTYMDMPKNKLTLGATVLTCELATAKVVAQENGFDQATIELLQTDLYPATVTADTAITLEVTDEGTAYPANPLFKGKVRFPIIDLKSDKKILTLSCVGSGYGFGDMVVVNEYGTESTNPTADTICEIATNINDNFVNKILGGVASGHSYTTDFTTTNLTEVIPFIAFPYKPVLNALNDLADLVSALNAGSAGPHWIVTTDDVLHLKQIGVNQAAWTKYYGGATNAGGQATLAYGVDYTRINSEVMKAEKNYIIYYGMWRRPSNGDVWTNSKAASWGTIAGGNTTFTDEDPFATTGQHQVVGTAALKCNSATSEIYALFPCDSWDFSGFTDFNTPNLNFYALIEDASASVLTVALYTSAGNYFTYNLSTTMTADNTWYHFSFPCGPCYKSVAGGLTWNIGAGAPDWSDINWIQFQSAVGSNYIYIDGLHFGDAPICRVAWNSDLPGGTAKIQLITDNVGKDDTLKAGNVGTTDKGLMASYAYAELLRKQKDTQNVTVETPMLHTALPGQYFSVQATDFRATKLTHIIDSNGYNSILTLTDDVTNSISRPRYEDQNKVWAAVRPEWQDRQAASIKAGSVDWRIAQLIENYAPP